MGKRKNWFSKHWPNIFDNLLSQLIWIVLSAISISLYGVISQKWDFLKLEPKVGNLFAILVYFLIILGFSITILFLFLFIKKKWFPKKENGKKSKIKLESSNSINTMCELAEKFIDDFELISIDENLLMQHQEKAQESFLHLVTYFEQTKRQFFHWKEIEDSLRKIKSIFSNYCFLLVTYLEDKSLINAHLPNSPNYDLASIKDQIFGESALKTIEKARILIRSIIDMLWDEY